jgi:hypothetical protein
MAARHRRADPREERIVSLARTILTEFLHLFVDDGSLALLVAVLIALVAAAVKFLTLPPFDGAVLLLAGCILILADSLRRAAARKRS